jgi:hypothetical protein
MAEDGVDPTLNNWPEVMKEAGEQNIIHFTTSPPGQPLVHYWVAEVLEDADSISRPLSMSLRPYQCSDRQIMRYRREEISSAGLGLLMPFIASLAAIPLFYSGRILSGEKDTALRIAQWWPLVPAVLLFTPTWNTVYPLLAIGAFALLAAGVSYRRGVFALLAGLVMSVGLFLNFSLLPLLLLFGLFTLGYWYFIARYAENPPRWHWPVQVGLWFGLGLSVSWVLFWLETGLTPLDIFTTSLEQHQELVQRDYLTWLWLHPYDTFLFIGWPIVGLAGWSGWRAVRQWRAEKRIDATGVLSLSLLITIIALDLSGAVQGENGRILMFYAPFLLVAAAPFFSKDRWWDVSVFIAQAAMMAVMATVLPVVALDLNPQPEGPRTDIAWPGDERLNTVDAVFSSEEYEGRFQLSGYHVIGDPAIQKLTVELLWEGEVRTERPYYFELVARADDEIDGEPLEYVSVPLRWYPQSGNYLTTCWRDGQQIRDVVVMEVPVVANPVQWVLSLRAVDERTGDVMQVHQPGQNTVNAALLGPVNYPDSQ